MKEHPRMQDMRLELGLLPHVRMFRNNVGQAWVGNVQTLTYTTTVYNAKPIRFGLANGSADLIGLTSITITPEMVGRRVAVFTSIEAKGASNATIQPGQPEWAAMVESLGGFSGFARSVEEAIQITEQWKEWK